MLGREDGANLTTLSPGEDIALKCSILSSPLHHTIVWTKEVNISSVYPSQTVIKIILKS